MNEIKKTTFWDRIKAAWRAFQGKPKTSLSIGVEVKQCSKCDREQIREMEWLDSSWIIQCSACGFSCGDDYYLGAGRFCPECGARARKPLREGAEI